jgi:hypothetical protein
VFVVVVVVALWPPCFYRLLIIIVVVCDQVTPAMLVAIRDVIATAARNVNKRVQPVNH